MRPKVVFGLNVFNEASFITTCLDEIYAVAHRIVIVDGAYEAFPYKGANGSSDDGTLQLVEQYPDPGGKIVLEHASGTWPSEIDKLNRYLAYGEPGCWIFRVDPDERVVGDWTAALQDLSSAPTEVVGFSVPFVETGGNRYKWFRLVRWRPDLRYAENHWRLFYGDTELRNYETRPDAHPEPCGPYRFEILRGVVLHHQEHDPERERLKLEYYQSQQMK